jgi:hypothetical protein
MKAGKAERQILKAMLWFLLIARSAADWFDKRRKPYEA